MPAAVLYGWPLLEQNPGPVGKCIHVVIRFFPLPGTGPGVHGWPWQMASEKEMSSFFCSLTQVSIKAEGPISLLNVGKVWYRHWSYLWKDLSLSFTFSGGCRKAAVLPHEELVSQVRWYTYSVINQTLLCSLRNQKLLWKQVSSLPCPISCAGLSNLGHKRNLECLVT